MSLNRWPVDIYLANHIVEEREAVAWDDAGRSEHLKAPRCESQRFPTHKTYIKKSQKP
jgi:hypothetical protein